MKLINPTNDELDAAFVTHVSHWEPTAQCIEAQRVWAEISEGDIDYEELKYRAKILCRPQYTKSFDAVLPWLYKQPQVDIFLCPDNWVVIKNEPCYSSRPSTVIGECVSLESLAKSATIALLRAHGIEIIFPISMFGKSSADIILSVPAAGEELISKSTTSSKLFHRKKFKKRL